MIKLTVAEASALACAYDERRKTLTNIILRFEGACHGDTSKLDFNDRELLENVKHQRRALDQAWSKVKKVENIANDQ